MRDICLELIKIGSPIRWTAFARPEKLELDLLKIMKKSGCDVLRYGIESGSQKILNDLNKGFTIEEAEKTIKNTKKAGIKVRIQLIVDTPTEEKEDILKTIEFIERNKQYIELLIIHRFHLSYGSYFYKKQHIKITNRIRNKKYLRKLLETIRKNNIFFFLTTDSDRNFVREILKT